MSEQTEMVCQELVEAITEYLEGTMDASDRVRFERHLRGCADCREYVAQMRATIRLSRGLPPGALPPATRRGLLDAFRDWKRDRTNPPPAG
jgi:anti-sigma factor RsiW